MGAFSEPARRAFQSWIDRDDGRVNILGTTCRPFREASDDPVLPFGSDPVHVRGRKLRRPFVVGLRARSDRACDRCNLALYEHDGR